MDEEGLLRAGGRLSKSVTIPYKSKLPIILPGSDDEAVTSIIRHVHTKNLHCSAVETFYLIRQKYFVLGGKTSVSKVVTRSMPNHVKEAS